MKAAIIIQNYLNRLLFTQFVLIWQKIIEKNAVLEILELKKNELLLIQGASSQKRLR